MNTIREIERINQEELDRGLAGTPASWHSKYAQSAWVYTGNLDHKLTEGDVICVLSQYGEIEDFHLVREEDTGKSKGFAFAKYEDARSGALAVDNLTGIQLCGRSLRVDHVENYRLPKHLMEKEEEEQEAKAKAAAAAATSLTDAGHAYQGQELANEYSITQGQDLFAPPPPAPSLKKRRAPVAAAQDDNSSSGSGGENDVKDDDDDGRRSDKRRRKEERREKRIRKEERRRKREKQMEEREEKKRAKRAARKAAQEEEVEEGDDNDNNDDDGGRKSRKKKRHKHRTSRSRSRSRSRSPDRRDRSS